MADQARDERILRWSAFLKHPQPDPACQIIDRRRLGNQGGLWPSTVAVIQQLNSHRTVSSERPIIKGPRTTPFLVIFGKFTIVSIK